MCAATALARYRRTSAISVLLVLITACGGGGGDGGTPTDQASNNVPPPQQPPPAATCTDSLETLVDNLGPKTPTGTANTPTWEQLSCFTDELVRFETPSFIKRILLGSDTLPEDYTAWSVHLEQIEQTWQDWPINVGNALPGPMPPYVTNGNDLRDYPMTLTELDLEMRSYATVLLYEKLVHGRPVLFSHFWPPYAVNGFDSQQDYLNWMETVYLPELEAVADAAEFVKAEYFLPFLLEAEQFANGLGPWFDALSESAQIALAQDFVDRVYDTVRPRYTGTLIAHSYARYLAIGDHWANISYAEYDLLNFALFPECNLEVSADYLDDQLEKYMTIVSRDSVPYMINELTVWRDKLFMQPCPSFDFDANEDAIYQLVFDKLAAQPIQPIGLSSGTPTTEDGRAVLRAYFEAH